MTDMTRTIKMIADCDEEVHFERQVKRELLRLHDLLGKANALAKIRATRIAELEAQLAAVGTSGVGPLIPVANSPEIQDSSDQGGQHLDMVQAGWKLVPDEPTQEMLEAGKTAHYDAENQINSLGAWEKGGFASRVVRARHVFQAMLAAAPQPVTLHLTMCADQHCPEYGTCYRAQAKAAPDQRFWAVSPREGNSCRFYAPMYFTHGASALRDGAQ